MTPITREDVQSTIEWRAKYSYFAFAYVGKKSYFTTKIC